MKVMNAFAQLFAIFSYLTLGSLLVIVSLHLLSMHDAVAKIQELYQNPMLVGFHLLFVMFFGIFLLHEAFTFYKLVGIILILTSFYFLYE